MTPERREEARVIVYALIADSRLKGHRVDLTLKQLHRCVNRAERLLRAIRSG